MADVFLSYSRVDTDKAMIIKDALEALGLEVFFDVEGLDSGDVFPDVLDREVKAAGAVLAVWSSTSINRPWVKKECGIAMERGVLVPVQIEPISLMDKPAAFSDLQYQDLEQFSGEADHLGWERTVRALAKTLKRSDLVKARKKQVVDKERAEKLAERLKEKDAEMQRLKKEGGGGYRFKLWHGVLGLATLALSIGGAVWGATSIQAAAFDRQLDDIFASNALEKFDEKAGDAREELAKILETVSIDALARKAETDGRAALLLGWVYFFDEGTEQYFMRAAEMFEKSCDRGIARGCQNLAFLYASGKGLERDYSEAVRLYRQACAGGNMAGCANLGVMYESGTGVDQDYAEAVRLYGQACDGGGMLGCNNLGVMYDRGKGVDQDDEEAVRLYRQACDGGNVRGCGNLGAAYTRGAGVERDYNEALRFYKKACDGGEDWACERLK